MQSRQIELLTILAEGCKKHPAYRARRRPKVECVPCAQMWEARAALKEIEQTETLVPEALEKIMHQMEEDRAKFSDEMKKQRQWFLKKEEEIRAASRPACKYVPGSLKGKPRPKELDKVFAKTEKDKFYEKVLYQMKWLIDNEDEIRMRYGGKMPVDLEKSYKAIYDPLPKKGDAETTRTSPRS